MKDQRVTLADIKQLPLDWIKDLDQKQREELEKQLRAARKPLLKIRQLVINKLVQLEKEQVSKRNYDSPSWAYLQADINGEVRGLQYYLQLTDFLT